jgi:uncharacterized damage-inducible protein DinB
MLLQALKEEFEHEAESTRQLLRAIPEKDLSYRPAPHSWTMGELAQHIATIYYWYVGTFTKDEYDLATDQPERGATTDLHATLELFESNVEKARQALQAISESDLQDNWVMKSGDKVLMGPFERGKVARSFLFNHLYHHRGELVVYLRATGNQVPGLYGPTYEDSLRSD